MGRLNAAAEGMYPFADDLELVVPELLEGFIASHAGDHARGGNHAGTKEPVQH